MGRADDLILWSSGSISRTRHKTRVQKHLGDGLVKLSRNSEALETYTKYLELAPNSKSASDVKPSRPRPDPLPSDELCPSECCRCASRVGDELLRSGERISLRCVGAGAACSRGRCEWYPERDTVGFRAALGHERASFFTPTVPRGHAGD